MYFQQRLIFSFLPVEIITFLRMYQVKQIHNNFIIELLFYSTSRSSAFGEVQSDFIDYFLGTIQKIQI